MFNLTYKLKRHISINQIGFLNKTMSKSSKKTKKNTQNLKNEPSPIGPIADGKNGDVKITIHAKPGAKLTQITDISPEGVGIAISAPPVEGEANTELVKYIANILGARKSDVSLEKGSRSRQKIVTVYNNTASNILQKFHDEMKNN